MTATIPLARGEHLKGIDIVEEELYKAKLALKAGQNARYKSCLQSAYLSLHVLIREDVGK